jgi:hypothetical protein
VLYVKRSPCILIISTYWAIANSLQIEQETLKIYIAHIINRVCISELTNKSVKALNRAC